MGRRFGLAGTATAAVVPPADRPVFARRARPDGSCDEYPFASTDEGGAGASIANVPVAEQHTQGGLMSGFYSSQRMLDGDSFHVAVVP
jgi:Deoxyribonuclease NucA/NucB